jgi:hypothetical protein
LVLGGIADGDIGTNTIPGEIKREAQQQKKLKQGQASTLENTMPFYEMFLRVN